MRQIKLTKDATLISLCSLNYSSSLALNQPASHERALLTPLHRRSLASRKHWLFCEIAPSTFYLFCHHISTNWPCRERAFAVLWKCPEFPLTETALTSISVVMCVYVHIRVSEWEGERMGKFVWTCVHVCVCARLWLHAQDCCENSGSTQAADNHVSGCFIDVLFSGMLHSGRSIWPYLHHPLLWNLITDIQLQSHHSLAVNIHWGSLRA